MSEEEEEVERAARFNRRHLQRNSRRASFCLCSGKTLTGTREPVHQYLFIHRDGWKKIGGRGGALEYYRTVRLTKNR